MNPVTTQGAQMEFVFPPLWTRGVHSPQSPPIQGWGGPLPVPSPLVGEGKGEG